MDSEFKIDREKQGVSLLHLLMQWHYSNYPINKERNNANNEAQKP